VGQRNIVEEILKKNGPLRGKELLKESKIDELSLWIICNKSKKITSEFAGRRFLRLDREVKGYARLTPSIKREFLTYTICGLRTDLREVKVKAKSLRQEIVEISKKKYELAKEIMSKIVETGKDSEAIKKEVCFIIAGDVVYEMAHLEPRPEVSTGEIVKGSDLDIVIIAEDNFSKKVLEELDSVIYREKYRYLKRPDYREEIDYVIKDMKKTKEQLRFEGFRSMLASKLLHEGRLLYGSERMFGKIKKMLSERKIPDRLGRMEQEAIVNRREAESFLLKYGVKSPEECMKLFYTREEAEEIF
jgi:hypothetical protein